MKIFALMFVTAVAAFVIPVQAIVNGRLGQSVQNPFLAAVISFLGGTIVLTIALVIWSRGLPTVPSETSIPWYLYTGGLLGAVYVTTVLCVVPTLGTANVIAAAIVGQLLMSLFIDQLGLLGVSQEPISLMKVCGAVLLIVGALLIQRG
ncbi:hypothetical protein KOR42_13840 [Thalassoglobus neptunius]|uniref:EamA-like transporter family protein n=1 Tax=Thalassoglobus neptunius TaxID=1938619 RepID=A0A5C5X7C3_9PLAN|nr:DMT family transporter [Thalassoglobus neptunius]TWT58015.1 hypothetical protein KOR42_13840 [Thalassoglobus neptunius]